MSKTIRNNKPQMEKNPKQQAGQPGQRKSAKPKPSKGK